MIPLDVVEELPRPPPSFDPATKCDRPDLSPTYDARTSYPEDKRQKSSNRSFMSTPIPNADFPYPTAPDKFSGLRAPNHLFLSRSRFHQIGPLIPPNADALYLLPPNETRLCICRKNLVTTKLHPQFCILSYRNTFNFRQRSQQRAVLSSSIMSYSIKFKATSLDIHGGRAPIAPPRRYPY